MTGVAQAHAGVELKAVYSNKPDFSEVPPPCRPLHSDDLPQQNPEAEHVCLIRHLACNGRIHPSATDLVWALLPEVKDCCCAAITSALQ